MEEEVVEETYVPGQPTNPLALQLDLERELMTIYWTLKGYTVIDDKLVKVGDPLLSDYGIQLVMNILRAYLHKGIVLSDLTDEDIRNIAFWLGFDIATALMKEYERTGVKEGTYELILDMITDNVYATLRRARGGTTARALREQIRIERLRIEEKEKTKGWFS